MFGFKGKGYLKQNTLRMLRISNLPRLVFTQKGDIVEEFVKLVDLNLKLLTRLEHKKFEEKKPQKSCNGTFQATGIQSFVNRIQAFKKTLKTLKSQIYHLAKHPLHVTSQHTTTTAVTQFCHVN